MNKDNKIQACTDEGVHDAVLNEFYKNNAKKNASILVLGAGFGALENKLIGDGYSNIVACDKEDRYKVKGIEFKIIDLNEDFSQLGEFDYVFAVEVVEHLENTFHFMRNLKTVIKDDGIIYVTTPNVHRKSLRLLYFITGKMDFFREKDIHESGHIVPILDHLFRYAAKKANLSILSLTFNRIFTAKRFIGKIKVVILRVVSLLVPGVEGVVSIYTIKSNV